MFSVLFATLMAIAPLARADSVIYNLPDAHATFYYDLTNSYCGGGAGDPAPANWAVDSGINDGIPYCQGVTAKSLNDLGTNRIVAMNMDMVRGDPAEWCGKEVQIIQADGSVFEFSEGPLFIWDACAACASASIIDLSAMAFTEIKGGTCTGNNPTGLTVEVLDTNIWEYGSGGGSPSAGASPAVASAQVAAVSPSPSATPSAAASATTSAVAIAVNLQAIGNDTASGVNSVASASSTVSSVASGPSRLASAPAPSPSASDCTEDADSDSQDAAASCTYGKWQCNGLKLEVCNYVSQSQLAWETVAGCTSVCEVDPSGSVDCQ